MKLIVKKTFRHVHEEEQAQRTRLMRKRKTTIWNEEKDIFETKWEDISDPDLSSDTGRSDAEYDLEY